MDELFKKYKTRIDSLPIAEEEKDKIYDNFYSEIQFKLVNAFFDTLTDEQKKTIAEAKTDEEVLDYYFSLLKESVEIPEFLEFIEQSYSVIMTKVLSELPEFQISSPVTSPTPPYPSK